MVDRYPGTTFNLLPFFFRQQDAESEGYLQRFFDAFDLEAVEWNARLDQVEQARDLSQIRANELEFKAGNIGGEIPTFFPTATRRRWLTQLIRFFKRKGSHDAIVDAIRTVLGIQATIQSPWNDPTSWQVGGGLVGIDTFVGGSVPLYTRPHPIAFVVGESEVGAALVGMHGTNIRFPRTFCVFLNVVPTADQLDAITYLINLLKPAEEHFKLVTPEAGDAWVLGESTQGLDTTLTASCWRVGFGLVGISTVICGLTLTPPDPETTAGGDELLPPAGEDPTVEPILTCAASLLPPAGEVPTVEPFELCNTSVDRAFYGINGLVVTTVGNILPSA